MVSPLAYIHPEAKIGENVEIAPFVFIDKNVVIGDNNKIMANVNILYGSRIGNGNTIFPGAVIGAVPQDLKFRGEESTAEIGDNNLIRENVTVNRGTAAKGRTIVGSNNLLMEGVHVAHDALIGNGCIIGNSTKMAGEIVIDDNAIISANVLMHQFCHVGSHVMIQGGCRFSKDIPPYIIAGREPIAFSGINIIGLRRRGFANEVIESIHNAYRIIYQSGLNTTDALKKIEDEVEKSPELPSPCGNTRCCRRSDSTGRRGLPWTAGSSTSGVPTAGTCAQRKNRSAPPSPPAPADPHTPPPPAARRPRPWPTG